jgi:hypothetical protein
LRPVTGNGSTCNLYSHTEGKQAEALGGDSLDQIGLPVPQEEFAEVGGWMSVDATEYIGEPGLFGRPY